MTNFGSVCAPRGLVPAMLSTGSHDTECMIREAGAGRSSSHHPVADSRGNRTGGDDSEEEEEAEKADGPHRPNRQLDDETWSKAKVCWGIRRGNSYTSNITQIAACMFDMKDMSGGPGVTTTAGRIENVTTYIDRAGADTTTGCIRWGGDRVH